MTCPYCGSANSGSGNKCLHCAKDLKSPTPKKRKSIWPKILGLTAIGLALGFGGLHSWKNENLSRTIQDQLEAIRTDHLTEAYYGYTSQDFQKAVSLEAFREFVKNYPALLKSKSLSIDSIQEDDSLGTLKGELIYEDNSKVGIEYHLVKESGQWKILNLQFQNLIADASKVAPKADSRELEELTIPVNLQLKALKQKDYEKSYQGLMTQDFEKNTPLDVYKRFVDAYPLLTQYTTFDVQDRSIGENQGKILVVLRGDNNVSLPIEYNLVREGNQWKIWSMRLVLPQTDESNENAKVLKGVIQAQIDAIDKGNYEDAYKLYTSKEFKTATSEDQFLNMAKNFAIFQNQNVTDINVDQVTKAGNVVSLNGFLSTKDNKQYSFEYDFVNENGEWKIVYMTIAPPNNSSATSVAKPSTDQGKLVLQKMDIGVDVDLNGNIASPSTVLKVKDGDIFANLFVEGASKGDKIEVILKHLESNSHVPPVTTTVTQDGSGHLSFVFSPPGQGWPQGNYEIQVSSPQVETKKFLFKVE